MFDTSMVERSGLTDTSATVDSTGLLNNPPLVTSIWTLDLIHDSVLSAKSTLGRVYERL